MKKLKIISSLLFLFLTINPLISQKPTCEKNIEQATELFKAGRYQEIDSILSGCMDAKKLDAEKFQKTAELLIQVNFLKKDYEQAEENLVLLLKKNPYYVSVSENPEIAHFASQYKSWRILAGSSMGLQFAPVSFTGHYDLPGVKTTSQSQGLSGLAYLTTWLGFDFFKTENFELITEFKNGDTQYKYSSTLNVQMPDNTTDRANFQFEEYMKWFELNLLANYHFPIKKLSFDGRIEYYAQLGGGYSWMRESRLENIILDPKWASDKTRLDAHIISRDGESLRRKNNYSILAGLGVTYRVSRRFSLYGQARYGLRLGNTVNTANRFSDATMTDDFYFVDDDKLLHGISFSAGLIYTRFFRWRKK